MTRVRSLKVLNSANFFTLTGLTVMINVLIIAVTFHKGINALRESSEQFAFKSISKHTIHTEAEGVDPEEKEVYHEFRTSFIPHEAIVMLGRDLQCRIQLYEESSMNHKNETFASSIEPIFKRERKDTGENSLLYPDNEGSSGNNEDGKESVFDEDYESSGESIEYEDDDYSQRTGHSNKHVDPEPLDDVMEQVGGQPELEEGEVSLPTHFYNLGRYFKGMHSFWKRKGDKNTIRSSQANIMKTFMDTGADPCHDFYQYACGNWAPNNPIPPDRAGYDTFEMLRENLDSVLKDLLELKSTDKITNIYPGAHLNVDVITYNIIHSPSEGIETDFINQNEHSYKEYKNEIVNRIRRYLDHTVTEPLKPVYKIKAILEDYMTKINRSSNLYKRKIKIKTRQKKSREKHLRTSRTLINKANKSKRHIDLKIHSHVESKHAEVVYDPANGDATLKAQFLFASCMNYKILQKRGHQPLTDLLNLLGGWPILDSNWKDSNFDWVELMARLRLYNNDILLSEWVGPDIMNSDEFVIQFDQTSLGLPSREYFLQDSNKIYLESYKSYLIKIALLLGGKHDDVKRSADQLIEFEIKLAHITSAPEDRRNISELYQRMPLWKLEDLIPEMQWGRYLAIVMNRTIKADETIVVFALDYVRQLVRLLEETNSTVISNYLMWRFVRHRVNNLDDRFQSAKQQFSHILFGQEKTPPRWKSCISQVNSNMGMALGSMFVRNYFDEISKNDTLKMTREIQQSFRELLHMTNWIDDKTMKLAADKVDAMMLRIGYPDFILVKEELDDRYKEVLIHPNKYFENILNILHHWTKMEQTRLGQPVNKSIWNTAPAVVNAYYSRNKNQILFPAGILQPPFYHRHFPRSLNYGGIGVVIGHEITHGFDDKGRLFDCDGNLHRWWSDTAIEEFHGRAQCLIDQYRKYVVPEVNMNLDGANTQGENIADNGGVKQAFRAYLRWIKEHGTSGETLPGLNYTHTQLFFLNFAQVWCSAMRPEAMRNKLKIAVHSPGRFRVIGTLSNSEDFARTFSCPPGSPMNPLKKCTVW